MKAITAVVSCITAVALGTLMKPVLHFLALFAMMGSQVQVCDHPFRCSSPPGFLPLALVIALQRPAPASSCTSPEWGLAPAEQSSSKSITCH